MVPSWMGGNETLHEDPGLRVVTRKNLGIAVWSASPDVSQIRALHRISDRFARSKPAGHALLSAIVRGTPTFSQEVRDELVKLLRHRSYTLGTAHLVLLDGLGGTAVRAFMSTVLLIARPPAPHRVFGKQDDALTWLFAQLRNAPEVWTQQELRDALAQALKGR
jgi:hypothetical protein